MPYADIDDLPSEQVKRYSLSQRRAFLKAFNTAFATHNGDEHKAFAIAHAAAQRVRRPEVERPTDS